MIFEKNKAIKISKIKILLTGGNGFLGDYVFKELLKRGVPVNNILIPRSKDLDLRIINNAEKVVKGIDMVIHLAANVGGIGYNEKHPAKLFYDNAIMGINLIEAAKNAGVKKFVQIGTVCAYPKFTPTPFKEENLWNGYPEETNAPYGLAKKILLVQLEAYNKEYGFNGIYLLPVNLYGPKDNFNPNSSHVIPALIKKFVDAVSKNEKEVVVWGTGKASREFLFVEDAARAIVLASLKYNSVKPVNIGAGTEIKIKKLVKIIAKITNFKGKIIWDKTKPDGQPKRKLDTKKAEKEFGFRSKINLEVGLKRTVAWYLKNI